MGEELEREKGPHQCLGGAAHFQLSTTEPCETKYLTEGYHTPFGPRTKPVIQ